MRQAKHGDTVKVHYRGKLHDGSVFDASFGREPLEFTVGEGEVIPGLEDAVLGMPAEKGFGPRREDLIGEVDKSKFAHWEREPTVGERVPIAQTDGTPTDITVTQVTESKVIVDANHPLAGEELTLDVELIDIVQGAH